jgi:ATP-binding cassette subfamily B protein
MLKLFRQLKPFTLQIIAIFLLLFAQAMSDLSLPSYMSDIVNVGIQQGGIESAVPQAIRASEFNRLALIMSDSDKAATRQLYTLLDRKALPPADYDRYAAEYPLLATEPVYVYAANAREEDKSIDRAFSRSIAVVAAIEKGDTAAFGGSVLPIPPGMDPFAAIALIPTAQLEQLRSAISTRLDAVPDSLLKQVSIAYLSAEYRTLGLDVARLQTAYMLRVGLLMLLLTLASVACSVTVGFLSARIAAALGRDLRRKLFVKVANFTNTEFDRFSTASLITRSTNDITQIQMLVVMIFRFVIYAPILGVGGILKVLSADTPLIWIIIAAVGAMMVMIGVMFAVALPKFVAIQKILDKLNLVLREILTGLMVIRAFNTQNFEEERFDAANTEMTRISLFINRVLVFMMPIMMLIMNGVMLLIIWVGAHEVDAGSIQVGDMMAFMQYAMQIIMSFLMVSFMFIMLPRANVSANRINEVLDTEPVVKDPDKPLSFDTQQKGMVEFRDVSFRYPGAEDDVIRHVTFSARPGQTTAIIGSTGSGKSTVVNLIPRFYDVTGGSVRVDGLDVKEVTQHDLRDKIGFIGQKAVLFSGTVDSNIRYANEGATEAEISRFAGTAQALDFITASEQGFATPVAQGGANFSGGQKQRLAIARALAKQPEIYVFDDSLSALDFKTDAALRRALRTETASATVIIVTQRVSTILGADKIVVLDQGAVAGIGTHPELMANCEVYREIAQSQLSREELVL